MGNKKSKPSSKEVAEPKKFFPIKNSYESLEQVQDALKQAGLESSNLIVGIDFTASNEDTGRISFGGQCLHKILEDGQLNPYQRVISILGRTLEAFDDDKLIPIFGFGDTKTGNRSVFNLKGGMEDTCKGFEEALAVYTQVTPKISLAGPTSFAPIIHKAIEIVKAQKAYHILVIVADGQVSEGDSDRDTRRAIVEASSYPLSIIVVGVGDGPWTVMEEFDDELPERKFDNFQFVDFTKCARESNPAHLETDFALSSLMEIPTQYQLIKKLGYLNK